MNITDDDYDKLNVTFTMADDTLLAGTVTIPSVVTTGTTSPYYINSGALGIGGAISGSTITSGISIKNAEPTIHTDKHKINIDEMYEDVLAVKQILIELAKDDDLLERNGVIRDILSGWLIKGLSK